MCLKCKRNICDSQAARQIIERESTNYVYRVGEHHAGIHDGKGPQQCSFYLQC